jgi:hypothetical protein
MREIRHVVVNARPCTSTRELKASRLASGSGGRQEVNNS